LNTIVSCVASLLACILLLLAIGFVKHKCFQNKEEALLFQKPLQAYQLVAITNAIQEMKIGYSIRDEKYIVISNDCIGRQIREYLAVNTKLPSPTHKDPMAQAKHNPIVDFFDTVLDVLGSIVHCLVDGPWKNKCGE